MARKWTYTTSLAMVALLIASGCHAADLKIGDAAPDWSGIPGTDGKKHSLSDYKDAKVIVMVFTCNHCPTAVAYQDRLKEFQKDYGKKGVQLIAVNVNNLPADKLDKMKERAEKEKFNFPYIYDSSQKMGRDYGAKTTPHLFVLCKERKVAYIGAMDDNGKADKVKEHYLRDAVDALLAGKKPEKTETRPTGCSVKYEKK